MAGQATGCAAKRVRVRLRRSWPRPWHFLCSHPVIQIHHRTVQIHENGLSNSPSVHPQARMRPKWYFLEGVEVTAQSKKGRLIEAQTTARNVLAPGLVVTRNTSHQLLDSLSRSQTRAHTQMASHFIIHLLILSLLSSFPSIKPQSTLCRTSCGRIPIRYPFGVDDGCGSPYYRSILACTNSTLEFRTPSGRYPVLRVAYDDPHIVISDPSMWKCSDGAHFRPTLPFSLDTSTRFTLSPQNDYLFFGCDVNSIIVRPKPAFCEHNPDSCASSCDSASYLCRNLPECPSALGQRAPSRYYAPCCSYYPKASESLRMMLEHCATYTTVHWKVLSVAPPYDQVPEYGIRIDFDIPVTTRCLQCQDVEKGGGVCGFDVQSQNLLCLCSEGNTTSYCSGVSSLLLLPSLSLSMSPLIKHDLRSRFELDQSI
ncbi:hypothetical protein ACLOJK_011007 [Asimina triloba]